MSLSIFIHLKHQNSNKFIIKQKIWLVKLNVFSDHPV